MLVDISNKNSFSAIVFSMLHHYVSLYLILLSENDMRGGGTDEKALVLIEPFPRRCQNASLLTVRLAACY